MDPAYSYLYSYSYSYPDNDDLFDDDFGDDLSASCECSRLPKLGQVRILDVVRSNSPSTKREQ